MAPRKPQPWAKIRAAGIQANKVKNASATPHSAWSSLNQQNNEHAGRVRAIINRKEEEELFGDGDGAEEDPDDEGEKKKERKKGAAKPKPKPKKIVKPARKGKASKPATTTTTRSRSTRSKPAVVEDDDDDAEDTTELWRPYGGQTTQDFSSSSCLGLARLATWQYPSFKTAIEEVLVQFGSGAELETEEIEHGGESNTDVMARFSSEEQAEMIKSQIEGDKVNGRKLQVRFVED